MTKKPSALLVAASGGKAKPSGHIDIAAMQSLSRQGEISHLIEIMDKSSVRVINFIDTEHPTLLKMWKQRQRGYRAIR